MAYIDSITTARDNVATLLASITANPKPNYSVDGESYSWGDYVAMLSNQLEVLDKAVQRAGGPFEVRSQGAS